jgi:hypothetical protein
LSRLFCYLAMILNAVTIAALPNIAQSADFNQVHTENQKDWTIIVSPYIWTASLNGKGTLAGFDTDVNVPFSDISKHLDFAVMGNIEITNDKLGAYFDGQYVRTSQDENLLGNKIGLDIKTTTLSAGAFFTAYETELSGNTVFGKPRTVSIQPTAGVRWTQLEAGVSALGVRADRSAEWTDPFVGTRLNIDVTDRWNLFSEIDVGGFGTGTKLSVNAQSYLGYRTMIVGNPTILRAGYRVLYQDYRGDDFEGMSAFRWNVTQHGPVVGFSMLF